MDVAKQINSWLEQGKLKAKLEKDGAFLCFHEGDGYFIERSRFTSSGRFMPDATVDEARGMKAEIEDLKKEGWKPHYGRVKETEGV